NKRKTGHCRISEKGVRYLLDQGIVKDLGSSPLRARDVKTKIGKAQYQYLIEVNEIYVGLSRDGWEFKDSRQAKREYRLNRSDLIQGILTKGGIAYGVYLLRENTQEQTVIKVLKEIYRSPIPNFLVFFKSKAGYELFQNKQEEMRTV